jgi:hypothetical protein
MKYFSLGERQDQIQILMVNKILDNLHETVYFSPGDSSVVIMAPKREGKGPKIPPTSSSSTKKQVTRKNPDPKPVAAVPDPEKLLRKPKIIPGQSSLSKENFPSTSTQGQSSKTVKLTRMKE